MAEQIDLVKFGTIKRYINDVLDMQVSDTGADRVRARFNEAIKDALQDAEDMAVEEDRKRILVRQIEDAMEDVLGTTSLEPEEILTEIKKLGSIETGNLVKMLNDHVDELKEDSE